MRYCYRDSFHYRDNALFSWFQKEGASGWVITIIHYFTSSQICIQLATLYLHSDTQDVCSALYCWIKAQLISYNDI